MRQVLGDFPEEIPETPKTPNASKIFNVRDEKVQELLDETRAQSFHHTVAQLLFTEIRCRKDSQTEITFLTTRVRKTDKDDWKRLRRLLSYLKQTIKLPLC